MELSESELKYVVMNRRSINHCLTKNCQDKESLVPLKVMNFLISGGPVSF